MNYTTQMDAARKGIITSQMKCVAAKENIDPEQLRISISDGKIIIPANKNHKSLDPKVSAGACVRKSM